MALSAALAGALARLLLLPHLELLEEEEGWLPPQLLPVELREEEPNEEEEELREEELNPPPPLDPRARLSSAGQVSERQRNSANKR